MKRFVRKRMGNNVHYATIYRSNHPDVAPYGVEKFRWNQQDRQLQSVWANPEISCPNGIPTMSEATGLLYCIGQRDGNWTLEGVDWDSGESVFHRPLTRSSKSNSFYSATEIGMNGNIFTGTFGGMLKFSNAPLEATDSVVSGESPTALRLNAFE